MQYYNKKIVEQEHRYNCKHSNSSSFTFYTPLYSKDGKVNIKLCGQKSGTKYTHADYGRRYEENVQATKKKWALCSLGREYKLLVRAT